MWRGPASSQLPMHTFQQLPLQCSSSWVPLISHGPPLPVLASTRGGILRETLMHALQSSARGRLPPPGPWERRHLGGQTTITRISCVGTAKLVAQQEHALPAAYELRPAGFLPKPLQRLQLQPGEVHVWWLFPDDVDAALSARYMDLLSLEERAYVEAALQPQVARERLLARVLTRMTLARYCDGCVEPGELAFARSQKGKPHLAWPSSLPLEFSLTHTGSLLGCAVAAGAAVGLDCEESSRHTHRDPLRLARRYFHPREIADCEGVEDAAARALHFVRVWTLKEAYVKASGQGFSTPPGFRGFSVALSPSGTSAGGCPASCGHDEATSRTHPATTGGADVGHGSANSTPGAFTADREGGEACRWGDPGFTADAESACGMRIEFESQLDDSNAWQLQLFDVGLRHTAALCYERGCDSASTLSRAASTDSEASSAMFYGADNLPSPDDSSFGSTATSSALPDEGNLVPSRTVSMDLSDDGSRVGSDRIEGGPWPRVRMFRTVPLVLDEVLDGEAKPRLLASTRGGM